MIRHSQPLQNMGIRLILIGVVFKVNLPHWEITSYL